MALDENMYAYEGFSLGLGLKGEGQYAGVSGALLETADELLQTSSLQLGGWATLFGAPEEYLRISDTA